METYDQILCPSPQFEQPSKLLHNAYDSEIDIRAAESGFSYQYIDGLEENRYANDNNIDDDDSMHVLKGFLKELDAKGHKKFKKLVAKLEKDVPIDRVLREALHGFKGKPGSGKLEKLRRKLNSGGRGDLIGTERGVDVEEIMKDKLERFKVKCVNVIGSGVVKEEGK